MFFLQYKSISEVIMRSLLRLCGVVASAYRSQCILVLCGALALCSVEAKFCVGRLRMFHPESIRSLLMSVLPYLVSTNLTRNPATSILVKTSDDFVRKALNTVGYTHRTNGCLSHSIQGYIIDNLLIENIMTSWLCQYIAGCAMSLLVKIIKVKQSHQ